MLLLILFIISLCEADPLPCPVPQDRENATYNGGLCFRSYSCCFRELIVEKNKTSLCCYAYGEEGAYKCCGRITNDSGLILALVLTTIFAVAVISIVLVLTLPNADCSCCFTKEVEQVGPANLDDSKDIPLEEASQ